MISVRTLAEADLARRWCKCGIIWGEGKEIIFRQIYNRETGRMINRSPNHRKDVDRPHPGLNQHDLTVPIH